MTPRAAKTSRVRAMTTAQDGPVLDESGVRSQFLVEASATLSESLDHRQTLRRVAELAVPRIADWCTVTALSDRGVFERIAVVHRDPAKQALVALYETNFPPGDHRAGPMSAALDRKTSVLTESVSDADLVAAAQSEKHLAVMRSLGCASCILVPMVVRGESIGLISLVRCVGRSAYGPQDVAIAEELAYRAGLAVDTSRLYQEARRREETMRFLADASVVLSSSLDCEPIFGQLARLVVPSFADWSVVDALEEGQIRQMAVAHLDPDKEALARAIDERYPADPEATWGPPNVVRTGTSELYETISDARLRRAAQGAEHLEILRRLGMRSALIVPLVARGKPAGTLTLVRSESGRPYGREDLMVMEDLGRRAGLSLENARLFEQAQNAVQLREDFLSMAGHELKTPLTGLHLQVSGIRRTLERAGAADVGKLGPRVATIDRQLARLTDLVDNLLDVSRATSGQLHLTLENMDLAEVLRDVADRFRDELAAKGCALSVEIVGPVTGKWDRLRLDEIVTNFLSNAMKYGAGKPITIAARRTGTEVAIEVKDQGMGISAADQSRIFRRFSRLASSQHYGGFGLGLWIAKIFVEAMGGHVEVRSTLGQGACFAAVLPWKGVS
jgi:signal transduction histidine kinase